MSDLGITELCRLANEASKRAGWQDEHRSIGDLIAMIHEEIAEAFHEYRIGKAPGEIYLKDDLKPQGMPIELADAVIRICQFCGQYNINLEEAIRNKMAYNETRGYRWEGKRL